LSCLFRKKGGPTALRMQKFTGFLRVRWALILSLKRDCNLIEKSVMFESFLRASRTLKKISSSE